MQAASQPNPLPTSGGLEMWFETRLPALYPALALILTSLLCLVTAPFFAPDEANQACRAISLSHGQFIPTKPGAEAGAQVDSGALLAMDGINDLRMDWERQAANRNFRDRTYGPLSGNSQRPLAAIRWAHRTEFVAFGNTAVYPPMLYLPAMAGWRLGEAADLTIFQSLRLARFLTALTAVALGWLALRLCACARWRLLPFLLLPSTLFLDAGCSQDALLLSIAVLIAALLTGPLAAGRQFTRAELVALATLLTLCGTARPPYAALALVLFLPNAELPGLARRHWLNPAVAFAAVMAGCALWRHLAAPLGLDWSDEADPDAQALFLRHHPLASAAALFQGVTDAALDFLHRGLYVIGWNDLLPHHGASVVLVVCLAAIVLCAPACPVRTLRGRALLVVVVAAPLLGIALAEYIIWTPPGFHTVYGIQPRYLLPLLPFGGMLVPSLASRLRIPRARIVLAATAALAAIACTLPAFAAHAFYREGLVQVLRLNAR
jgi:uncharacterized membrane protein